ncbi:MAG TPA: sigma-70 family RNA polymerase sigma factor, partial [Kofleriaceae bacterium]|nr:sigma-70 family RNA polymerase sigma factor [Kofleriaceae bacterium]
MEGATRLLMQRYGTKVYGYCRQQLRDATLAEDVNQVVFAQAFAALPKFDRKSTVRTWLYSIAHHRVLDAIKARRRQHKHLDGRPVDKNQPDDRLSPGEKIDETRLLAALADCLQRLPSEVRTAVLLRYQAGLSFEEMAKVLGVRAGT